MIKNLIGLLLTFLISVVTVFAQNQVNEQLFSINKDSVTTNTLNRRSSVIVNDGEIILEGNIENHAEFLFDSTSTGSIIFTSDKPQYVYGTYGVDFSSDFIVNNASGVLFSEKDKSLKYSISGNLHFMIGKIILNQHDLTLYSDSVTGVGASTHISTNSSGSLRRYVLADGISEVLFPIGNSSYNPVLLRNRNTATNDFYKVRVEDKKPLQLQAEHLVNRSWIVAEDVVGGSELDATIQWNVAEELESFVRETSTIGLSIDHSSPFTWGNSEPAIGLDPYTAHLYDLKGGGTLVVGDYFYAGRFLELKLFLGGPFNSTTNRMNTQLRNSNLLPLMDPYGHQTVTESLPLDIVDWIEVELRDAESPDKALEGVLLEGWPKALLLNKDGNVVNTIGNRINIGNPDYYQQLFVVVRHRNHLDIVSSNPLEVGYRFSYDFSGSIDQVYGGSSNYTQLTNQIFGMIPADVDADGFVFSSDFNLWAQDFGMSDIYLNSDIDLDGHVFSSDYNLWAMYFGSAIDKNSLKNLTSKSKFIRKKID